MAAGWGDSLLPASTGETQNGIASSSSSTTAAEVFRFGQRRERPTSSATSRRAEPCVPSFFWNVSNCILPVTTTRSPLCSDCETTSACSSKQTTSTHVVAPSFFSVEATEKFAICFPDFDIRSSGALPTFPVIVAVIIPALLW